MIEQWEVERAEEWRKRAKATARRARWRGEDRALRDAVNVKLAGKRRAGPWEDRTVGDLFEAEMVERYAERVVTTPVGMKIVGG